MLCDSPNFVIESSVRIEKTEYNNEMPSNRISGIPLSSSNINETNFSNLSFSSSYTSTSLTNDYSPCQNRVKISKHPNIHHHPTIHPHSRHQRTLLNNLANHQKINTNCVKMPENNLIVNNNYVENVNFNDDDDLSDNIFDNNNDDHIKERKEIENDIKIIQGAINDLNNEIFKDQSNYRRPPSEYLDVYNELTQQLHFLQEKKENLELRQNIDNSKSLEQDDDKNSLTPPSRDSPDLTDEYSKSRIPRLKLDNSSSSLKYVQTPTTPTSPLTQIFPISPTNLQSDAFVMPQTNSLVSLLPTSSTNPNLSSVSTSNFLNLNNSNQNSRSFNEISDVSQNSLSPLSSHVGTPTTSSLSSNSSSPFLRIFIGSSTAVVEKKPVPLRDVVSSKLKNRNLEINKCIAYIKDLNFKIDWDIEVNKLKADNIVVAEISDEIRHSFEKKTLTLRSCDSCKKRILLNVYACTKCYYVMCRRNECRTKSEQVVCALRKISSSNSLVGSMYALSKPELDYLGRPESPSRDSNNISQQILPVNQLKDTARPVPKSPSTMSKLTVSNNIYGTMPRNQYLKSNASNIDEISGSVNQESGSVLSSMNAKSLISDSKIEPKVNRPIKQNKPSRRDSFNSWEIPFKQINIDMNKKVGSGSFGIVHQGRDFYHGIVAVKFLNVQNPTPNQSNAFRNEVAILKSTRHDNILLFIGCILKPYMALVTEWCPGSSLYRHIHVEEEQWDMTQLIDIAKQTSIGMEYLHARDILHRDLKSNNIFLIPKEQNQIQRLNNFNSSNYDYLSELDTQKWTVKIGDFGLATVKSTWTQSTVRTNQPTGSILWMAPEVIKQKVNDPYTQKSDVYSYSVVLYELFTGSLPYQHKEQNMILFLVGSGRLRPNPDDCRSDTPSEIKELIKICSDYDRDKRLDFVQINEKFKKIKMLKLKLRLQRAKSVPNVSFNQLSSHLSGLYEEDFYPTTPQLELKQQLNLPSIFSSNSIYLSETSQLITNL
ncbi:unnamed protein product [Brachionus calyciflorus]|uniref:non-specific serine/threonine protein kinase n=1 Tax=Brachionus calyciflorus TaxID=104777 RepID=A0A813UC28_9BILA|nr:unnamed protein product [Brachionus calyciflorus]